MKKMFLILSLVIFASCTQDEIENDKSIKGIWVTQSGNYNKFVIFEDNGIGASFQLYDHKKSIRKNETRQAGIKAPNPTIIVIDNSGMHTDLTTGDTYVDKGTLTVKMFANASEVEGYRLDCKWKLTDEKSGKYWFEYGSNIETILDKSRNVTIIEPIITYTLIENEEIYWLFDKEFYELFRIIILEDVSDAIYMESFRYYYDNQEQTITLYDNNDYMTIYNIVEHNTEKLHISNAYKQHVFYKYNKSIEEIEKEYDIVLKLHGTLPF